MKKRTTTGMVAAPKLQTLEEIEARRQFSRFKANTVAEYEDYIRSLDDADIRSHATVVGLRPSSERRQLILGLLAHFRTAKAQVSKFDNPQQVMSRQVVSLEDDYTKFMAPFRS